MCISVDFLSENPAFRALLNKKKSPATLDHHLAIKPSQINLYASVYGPEFEAIDLNTQDIIGGLLKCCCSCLCPSQSLTQALIHKHVGLMIHVRLKSILHMLTYMTLSMFLPFILLYENRIADVL